MSKPERSASVWARFEKYSPPKGLAPDECWPWQGSLDGHGYGQLSDKPNRTVLKAHRLAYEKERGEIPEGLEVCHTCDNPPCLNPKHLIAATHSFNMEDKLKKGRNIDPPLHVGERHPHAILSAADVLEIRASGSTGADLARRFGVAQSTISAIRNRVNWAHI